MPWADPAERFARFFEIRHPGIVLHCPEWKSLARGLYPVLSCALDGIDINLPVETKIPRRRGGVVDVH